MPSIQEKIEAAENELISKAIDELDKIHFYAIEISVINRQLEVLEERKRKLTVKVKKSLAKLTKYKETPELSDECLSRLEMILAEKDNSIAKLKGFGDNE